MTNLNELGIISEVSGARARVAIGSMVTDFLPVIQMGENSFKTTWEPLRVGEQCIVLPIRGELNSGIVIRGAETLSYPVPSIDENIEIIKFNDGMFVKYDNFKRELEISNLNSVSIKTTTSVTITAPNVFINGNLKVSGDITDSRGDLTGHSHSDTDGYVSSPR